MTFEVVGVETVRMSNERLEPSSATVTVRVSAWVLRGVESVMETLKTGSSDASRDTR